MSKLNNIKLIGYISTEIKTCATNNGWWMARFSLNVLRAGAKEPNQTNDFISIKYLNKNGDKMDELAKGKRVELVGELHIDRAEKDGVKQNWTNITTFDVKVIENGTTKPKPEDDEDIRLEDLPF